MQANIVELPQTPEQSHDEAYVSQVEELIATDPGLIRSTNAREIETCVMGSRFGVERFAYFLRKWLDDPSITAHRLLCWMRGEGEPTLLQARCIYLLARQTVQAVVSANLSRVPLLFLALAPFLQLPEIVGQIT